jgi:hypothetical protein
MEVVLRPINDHFLREVLFPAFELGVVDAVPAIEHLFRHVTDEGTRVLLELMLEHLAEGSFFGLTDERWSEAVYRLLFHEWYRGSEGWSIARQYPAYAGPWEETFHLALMLENQQYPYAEAEKADAFRRAFWTRPQHEFGLATLLTGTWDPLPSFPPDQVLTAQGNGLYNPEAGVVRADWAWRPIVTVRKWAAQLPIALNSLIEREVRRLRPVTAPEKQEVLDYWMGRTKEPPVLAVSFSGLGTRTQEWIREIGALASIVRVAATAQQGLTAVLSRKRKAMDNLDDNR